MGIEYFTKSKDLSVKYLLIFYELTKMGVVQFDLKKPSHLTILAQMILLCDSYDPAKYKDCPESVRVLEKQRYELYKLIAANLYKYAKL